MNRTPSAPKLVALACLIAAPGAQADQLSTARRQPLAEVSHDVALRIRQGVASFTVRRSIANTGQRHDEARLRISMPYGAAATGLRIRASRRWYDGELMEAERAAELYRELTGIGPHEPRDPALLRWRWSNELWLNLFPVAPQRASTVEYSLTAPTRYTGGRYVVTYPLSGRDKNLAPVVLRVLRRAAPGAVTIDGHPVAAGQPVVIQDRPESGWLAKQKLSTAASHTVSQLQVLQPLRAARVRVELDIRHTYRGDLRVQLVSPQGKWTLLHDRAGGSDNHLRETREVTLAKAGSPPSLQPSLQGTWRLVVSDHAAMDVGSIDGWALLVPSGKRTLRFKATDVPRAIADAPTDGTSAAAARIEVAPPPIHTLTARLGRAVAGPRQQFLRLEVDVAPQLRALPQRPSVVFLLDASHSMGPKGIEAQLQLVRAFLDHVPDAAFQLVRYSRRADALTPHFTAPTALTSMLAQARTAGRLSPQNGSALDAAIALGSRLLRGRVGPRYLLMLTDGRLRSRWRTRVVRRLLARPRPPVTHLVLVKPTPDEALEDQRADEHPLAPLATVGGGIALRVRGLPLDKPSALGQLALGLVRPVRIDAFRVRGLPLGKLEQLPETLDEGEGLRQMVQLSRAPRQLVLTGKIWSTPLRRVVQVDRSFSRHTAAFVFSHDMYAELDHAAQLRLARMGRAVSPVTSYLAIEPGVRPSLEGLHELRGRSAYGAGYGRGSALLRSRLRPALLPLLAQGQRQCVEQHHPPAGWSVPLTVETTLDEVVDVQLPARPGPMARCLAEAVWALRLPETFDREHDTYPLTLR